MNLVEAIKNKYLTMGCVLKKDFEEKLLSVFGNVWSSPEWEVKNTEIIFSIKSVYPYITFRPDKLKKVISIPGFSRFAFYPNSETDIGMCLSFNFSKVKNFKILKNELYSLLWEELSIPVSEKVVVVESDFRTSLLVDRDTTIDSFLDVNLELTDLSMSDMISFNHTENSSTISINGLVNLNVKTNYKVINIRSEV